jgi:hypothetical protein
VQTGEKESVGKWALHKAIDEACQVSQKSPARSKRALLMSPIKRPIKEPYLSALDALAAAAGAAKEPF